MLSSIDGKVTGDFLMTEECEKATDIYYEINRSIKSDGFICGRTTMEESFTNGYYPDLNEYLAVGDREDYIPEEIGSFFAVAFDTNGKLGFKQAYINDDDPGYDKARIIEVLSEEVDDRFLGYLKAKEIPYIFAGKDRIDVNTALDKLKSLLNINTLLLEGGSKINGSFQKCDAIDELSIVLAPVVASSGNKSLFSCSDISGYELMKTQVEDSVVTLQYKRKANR